MVYLHNNLFTGYFTTMIGFITWPPFCTIRTIFYKRWPSDKANCTCEMLCKLLYIIQVKGSSWSYLISKIMVAYNHMHTTNINAASDWPYTLFTAKLFLFRYIIHCTCHIKCASVRVTYFTHIAHLKSYLPLLFFQICHL